MEHTTFCALWLFPQMDPLYSLNTGIALEPSYSEKPTDPSPKPCSNDISSFKGGGLQQRE